MKVKVNNKVVETEARHLSPLLQELQLPQAGVAVGVQGRMVPKSEWDTFALGEGAEIVVVRAACGG